MMISRKYQNGVINLTGADSKMAPYHQLGQIARTYAQVSSTIPTPIYGHTFHTITMIRPPVIHCLPQGFGREDPGEEDFPLSRVSQRP